MNAYTVQPGTVARLIILVLLLVNQMLVMLGKTPIGFVEEELYAALSTVLTILWSLWAAWKNTNITQEALAAQEYLDELKAGK